MIKLYFFDIQHNFNHELIESVDGLKIVVEELKSDEGMMAIVVMNLDKIFKSKEISYLIEREDAFIVAVTSSDITPAEIRAHQDSKLGADIYFRGPLDDAKLRQAVDVFELNEFIPNNLFELNEIMDEVENTPLESIEDDMSEKKENDESLIFEVSSEEENPATESDTTQEENDVDIDFDLPGDTDTNTDLDLVMEDDIPEPEGPLETEAISLGDGDLETDALNLDEGTEELNLGEGELGTEELNLDEGEIETDEIDLGEENIELGADEDLIEIKVDEETGEFEVDLTQEVEVSSPLAESEDDDFDEDTFSEFDYKTAIMPSAVREEQLAKVNEGQESQLSEELVQEEEEPSFDLEDNDLSFSEEENEISDDDLFEDLPPSTPSVSYSDSELSKMGGTYRNTSA